MIVPLPPTGDRAAIAAMYPPTFANEQRTGSIIAAPDRDSMDQLKAMKIIERPELRAAFAASGNGAVQCVILSPRANASGKPITDQGPLALLLTSPEGVADKFVWAALSADINPHAALRVTIQCQDAAAAKQLHDASQLALGLVRQAPNIRAAVSDLDTLLPLLQPKLEADRLTWSLDEQHKNWPAMLNLLSSLFTMLKRATDPNPLKTPQALQPARRGSPFRRSSSRDCNP